MLKKTTVIRQLWMLSFFLVGIITLLGGFTFWHSAAIYTLLQDTSTKKLPAIRNMVQADMLHDGLRAVVVESLYAKLKGEDSKISDLLNEANEKSKDFHQHIESLEGLELSQVTNSAINETKPALKIYTELSIQIVNAAKSGNLKVAEGMKPQFDESFEMLEAKLKSLGDLIEKEAAQSSTEGSSTLLLIGSITLAGVVLGLFLSVIAIRNLKRNMKQFLSQVLNSTENISSSSERLSLANEEFSTSATESSASLQETVASLEEISSMVKLNSDNAKKASEVSIESRQSAEKGEKSITELSVAMLAINTSSKKMEEIINVIDDIAFQTNLLALNAAVEAARAGEQGRGFAVVAEAVRSLAQRSASAAKDISQMIKESITRIESGTQIVETSRASLNTIFNSVKQVSDLNHQISNASQEQSQGLRQISEAMNQIDSATQRNSMGAQEVAEVSNSVLDQSKSLKDLVSDLNVRFLGSKQQSDSVQNNVYTIKPKVAAKQDDFFADSSKAKRKVGSVNDF